MDRQVSTVQWKAIRASCLDRLLLCDVPVEIRQRGLIADRVLAVCALEKWFADVDSQAETLIRLVKAVIRNTPQTD